MIRIYISYCPFILHCRTYILTQFKIKEKERTTIGTAITILIHQNIKITFYLNININIGTNPAF